MYWLMGACAAAMLLGGYAVFWEPGRLVCNLLRVRVGQGGHAVRVVQISDLHLGFFYGLRRLRAVVDAAVRQKPDLIVFTGDLLNKPNTYRRVEQVGAVLCRLRAPMGVYAVRGNHDCLGKPAVLRKITDAAGIELLVNRCVQMDAPGGGRLILTGLDDGQRGSPDFALPLTERAREEEEGTLRLLLLHEPDFAQGLLPRGADVMLAGHTHGGQIRLPGVGALYWPKAGKKYTKGLYPFGPAWLHVDSGAGQTGFPARFLCPPQISVLDISFGQGGRRPAGGLWPLGEEDGGAEQRKSGRQKNVAAKNGNLLDTSFRA